jgi:transglutaminase-like putative cysteine protease
VILSSHISASLVLSAALLVCATPLRAQTQWTAPTPEELSMTSIPEVAGAPAVILFSEQTAEDNLHMWSFYQRIKVLTEGGKDQANVELPYITGSAGVNIDSITGRTIHADGTIIPFTGKPYDKLVEKTRDYKVSEKVFTLPDVEVGSIIEFRYKLRFDDGYYISPDWFLQSELFARKEHFDWKPTGYATNGQLTDGAHVAWTTMLPQGATVEQKALHTSIAGTSAQPTLEISLDVSNVPALPKDSNMPPVDSLSYRVLFYYTTVNSPQEYWTQNGKIWSKARDKFIGPGSAVKEKAAALVAPGDSEEVRLKKAYDFVMSLENTDFTRKRSQQENKAAGEKEINNTDDVLKRGRGSSDELAMLFVALARASGSKVYLMAVTNRDQALFQTNYLTLRQLDDDIAVANIDGKDVFFDPGERYCTFKQLAWKHSMTGGLRQTDKGTELSSTPFEPYKSNHVSRIADLTLDERGTATGAVIMSYTGDAALRWRQSALRGDETSLHRELRESLEEMLPGGMDIKVVSVQNLTDPDKPLAVNYKVTGPVGNPTGKRLFVPANLFETNSKPIFTKAKRELFVDMHYADQVQDAVRYKYPAGIVVESAPAADEVVMKNSAVFSVRNQQAESSITLYRNLTIGKVYFSPEEYPDLHAFYAKVDGKLQDTLVLTHDAASAAKPASGGT